MQNRVRFIHLQYLIPMCNKVHLKLFLLSLMLHRQIVSPSLRTKKTTEINPSSTLLSIGWTTPIRLGRPSRRPNVAPYDVRLWTDHGRLQLDIHRINLHRLRKRGGLTRYSHSDYCVRDSYCDYYLFITTCSIVAQLLVKLLIIINHNNLQKVLIIN